ncbi:hypothetical protein F4809DRAFT_383430 [Biscogniauxia mediterranea]|nr:hypothetical protein F4809DRAFT_383430 [Biscogniauxia mediterranea]
MEQQPPEEIQSELESFREQWKAEVSARARNAGTSQQQQQPPPPHQPHQTNHPSPSHKLPKRDEPSRRKTVSKTSTQLVEDDDDDDYVPTQSFDELDAPRAKGQRLDAEDATSSKGKEKSEPKTALDFYEHAVERETTGKLGDSLQLYRTAFRMDSRVDISYRDKHFPGRWKQQPNPSGTSVTVPNTAHHSLEGGVGGAKEAVAQSLSELLSSFAEFAIEGSAPESEGMPAPPCPIATLPDEILIQILRDLALADVGDFVRLMQVCRRLAYLVATEDQIWRRICVGPEFGFGGMHHHWQRDISWGPLGMAQVLGELSAAEKKELQEEGIFSHSQLAQRRAVSSLATTNALLNSSLYNSSWQRMFRRRPRIRFNGCYISTVNYIRAGQHGANQTAWGSPVHIVTYYRYLRFFRDGTVISLLSTEEPAHVVHHLTKENIALHRPDGPTNVPHHQHLPSVVMSAALKGRWRLSSSSDHNDDNYNNGDINNSVNSLADAEGDLYIETEGAAGPKYTYRMELSFRSSGRAAGRNNKLVWKGFWSYNRLTDDWAEFTLKNDKPFFFSRVKSYGVGE